MTCPSIYHTRDIATKNLYFEIWIHVVVKSHSRANARRITNASRMTTTTTRRGWAQRSDKGEGVSATTVLTSNKIYRLVKRLRWSAFCSTAREKRGCVCRAGGERLLVYVCMCVGRARGKGGHSVSLSIFFVEPASVSHFNISTINPRPRFFTSRGGINNKADPRPVALTLTR